MIKSLFIIMVSLMITNCSQTNEGGKMDIDKIKQDVWKTVLAHNKAWTELEDVNEQKKYIHDDIIFIAPPYKKPIIGSEDYLRSYKEDWMEHATIHNWKEVDPVISIYLNGKMAQVTYTINMSFDFDDNNVPEWIGIDFMTLINENGKWLILSDMYAKQAE